MKRVARNVRWLVFAEGFTKAASPVANVLLARFLASTRYGVLTLAQTWAIYASISADFGVSVYGQAEAARAGGGEELARFAEDVIPLRMVAGLVSFAVFSIVAWLVPLPGPRSAFLMAGLYIPAVALTTDWLFRGRERFDLTLLANGAAMAFFLLAVVAVGSRRNALLLDLGCWALTSFVLGAVYLSLLRRIVGIRLRFKFAPARWIVHLRQSAFVFLSAILLNSYRFLPLVLLGWFRSAHEVGIFAAPYRLIINLQSMAMLLPAAFYPVGASLFRDSSEQFHQSRRRVAVCMLMAGLPVGILGCRFADPAMTMIFGRDFAESGLVFALIIWLIPLYLIRSIHATTILSTGFYRVQFLAPACGLTVALIAGALVVPAWGAIGASVGQLVGETSMVIANLLISRKVHGEVALPGGADLWRLTALNLLLALAAVYLPDRIGWTGFALIISVGYPGGLIALGMINPLIAIAWMLPEPGRLAK